MDLTVKQWAIGIILIVIIVILIDGFRRMRNARHDSLHMSLDVKNKIDSASSEQNYGSEFPNGGARPSVSSINKQRIDEVKNQYDFGRDMSSVKPNNEETYNSDQWVDAEEGDEEYYASQWDDEESDDNNSTADIEPGLSYKSELSCETMTATESVTESVVEAPKEPTEENTFEEPVIAQAAESVAPDEKLNADSDEVLDKEHYEISASAPTNLVEEQEGSDEMDESLESNSESTSEPMQVQLNLEESVPVLMESIDDEVESAVSEPILADDAVYEQSEIRSVGKRVKPAIEPTIGDEEVLDTRSANKPRYESKYFSGETEKTAKSTIEEVLVINVKAREGGEFQGSDLLSQVLENGLRYGAMNIFHYHADEDGEGPVLFSMANMLKPGIFDLKTIDHFATAGVTLFLTLPVHNNENLAAFEAMLATAKSIAESLNGELKDEDRSVMTAQTIEHYRERIRDFARRQQLEKNK